MNTITRHRSVRRGIAAAAIAMAAIATAACGSETASAPAKISDPIESSACTGSAEYAERACRDTSDPGAAKQPDADGWIR